ncbi:MAG: glycosyltransferase family 39 protein [Pseudomonadota bacterium]
MGALLGQIERAFIALVGFAEVSGARRSLVVILVGLLVLLPGLVSLPVTDRDEARFAQASRQMLETGDFIDIRLQEEARWKKPAGIYWLQAGSAWLYGGAEAPIQAYRLPSFLGALLAAMLTGWAVGPLVGRRGAVLAAIMTVTSVLVVVEGHIAKTDAMLLLTIVAAQGALVRIWQSDDRGFGRMHVLFWAAIGVGALIKGPIILLPVLGTVLWLIAFERRLGLLSALSPGRGLLLALLIAAPWYVAIAERTGGAFFEDALVGDLLSKVTAGAESHGAPPGYYLATIWGTFWPWAALLLLAAPFAWRERRRPEVRFLLGWIIPTWLVLALTATKLPHYILPVFPALAAFLSLWLIETQAGMAGWPRRLLAAAVYLVVGGALALFAIFGPAVVEGTGSFTAISLGGLALVLILVGARALFSARRIAFFGASTLAALALYPALFAYTLPLLDTAFLSPRMAAAHATFAECSDRPLTSVGYREPSLVFVGGIGTELPTVEDAAARLRDEDGWLVFFAPHRGITLTAFEDTVAAPLQPVATVAGYNYNWGRDVVITLLARADDPMLTACPALAQAD